jgi:hypothetical protein
MSITTITRTCFPCKREYLSAVHTAAGDDRPRGIWQSSCTCNLHEKSTERSAGIGESPRETVGYFIELYLGNEATQNLSS